MSDIRSGAPAAEVVYAAVRDDILAGRWSGGDRLREEDLAADAGVSRTPVREALRRLAAEGLVRYERNRGATVQSWSVHDLDEIFGLRSVLEPWAARLAAEAGRVDVDALADLADRMDKTVTGRGVDVDRLTELNNRFHAMVLAGSGNGRLGGVVTGIVQVPLVWRTFSRYSGDALRRSLTHHHEIVDALRARDGDWAEAVMRSHVRAAWTSLRAPLGAGVGEVAPEVPEGGTPTG